MALPHEGLLPLCTSCSWIETCLWSEPDYRIHAGLPLAAAQKPKAWSKTAPPPPQQRRRRQRPRPPEAAAAAAAPPPQQQQRQQPRPQPLPAAAAAPQQQQQQKTKQQKQKKNKDKKKEQRQKQTKDNTHKVYKASHDRSCMRPASMESCLTYLIEKATGVPKFPVSVPVQ